MSFDGLGLKNRVERVGPREVLLMFSRGTTASKAPFHRGRVHSRGMPVRDTRTDGGIASQPVPVLIAPPRLLSCATSHERGENGCIDVWTEDGQNKSRVRAVPSS